MSRPTLTGYARRLADLPRALHLLELHPDGLPLDELAAELGTSVPGLRETFLAYYRADLVELGDWRLPAVEFLAAEGSGDSEEVDPGEAERVRVVSAAPERELGVSHLPAEDLARLYEAGADLLALEPDNEVLRCALEAFQASLWPVDLPAGGQWLADVARDLRAAVEHRRRVRITYVRQWHPGRTQRVIEPYRLTRTRRGWEVDAGPADDRATVRTYLVSGISEYDVLDETFELPADAEQRVAANRRPVEVELVVPQTGRWAVDRFGESVTLLGDDETDVSLRVALLPPVEQRLGLILASAGPEAFVVSPAELREAGASLARDLLAHHTAGT